MYKEEEIRDSLEFCRDIEIYYGKRDEKAPYMHDRKGLPSHQKNFEKAGMPEKEWDSAFASKSFLDDEEAVADIADRKDAADDFWERAGILGRIFNNLFAMLIVLCLAYGISSFLTNFCIWQTQVDGISMEPALEDGDRLIIDKLSYRFHEPERFDIIVFPQELDVYYVKRIIGIPGETVEIRDGKIYIDGIILAENYGNEPMDGDYFTEEPITLGEGEYFVLGDNRNYSIDSRDASVGLITREHIVGKAWVILYPFENIRFF